MLRPCYRNRNMTICMCMYVCVVGGWVGEGPQSLPGLHGPRAAEHAVHASTVCAPLLAPPRQQAQGCIQRTVMLTTARARMAHDAGMAPHMAPHMIASITGAIAEERGRPGSPHAHLAGPFDLTHSPSHHLSVGRHHTGGGTGQLLVLLHWVLLAASCVAPC